MWFLVPAKNSILIQKTQTNLDFQTHYLAKLTARGYNIDGYENSNKEYFNKTYQGLAVIEIPYSKFFKDNNYQITKDIIDNDIKLKNLSDNFKKYGLISENVEIII